MNETTTKRGPWGTIGYEREDLPPVWGYASYPDSDRWTTAKSREAAEEAASELEDGGWIVEGRWIDAGKVAAEVADMDGLLERMDEVEEVAIFDEAIFENTHAGAEEALREALRTWARAYVVVTNWLAWGEPIRVEPRS